MRESASRGYFLASKAPFGYNRIKVSDGVKDRPTLEVDPVAAPIVKEIFESSRRGNGLKEICKELNGRGITNRGRRWQKNIVHYLLTNEAYTGTAVWGVKRQGRKGTGAGAGGERLARAGVKGRPSTQCSRGFTSGRPRCSGLRGWGASIS